MKFLIWFFVCLSAVASGLLATKILLQREAYRRVEEYKQRFSDSVGSETTLQAQIRGLQGTWGTLLVGKRADGGNLLSAVVRWASQDKKNIKLPTDLKQWISNPSEFANLSAASGITLDDPGLLKAVAASGLNLGWMGRLKDFDHWNLGTSKERWYPQLLPVFEDFWAWSKARLSYGMNTRDLKTAVDEVTKLALLMVSTEDINIAIESAKLFDLCREAVGVFEKKYPKSKMNYDIPSVPNFTSILAKKGRLIDIASPSGLIYDLYISKRLVPTICIELQTRYPMLVVERTFLASQFPDGLSQINQLVDYAQRGCRLSLYSADWENPKFVPERFKQKRFSLPKSENNPFIKGVYTYLGPLLNPLFGGPNSLPGIFKVFPELAVILGIRIVEAELPQ